MRQTVPLKHSAIFLKFNYKHETGGIQGMANQLISADGQGRLAFGDYTLPEKTKQPGFEFEGDIYKVKTFKDITKLEKNDLFVYESVPGTAVSAFEVKGDIVSFCVEGETDAQITLELEPEQAYEVFVDGESAGQVKTNLGGKLALSAALGSGAKQIEIRKAE